jgi:hypothetical protein
MESNETYVDPKLYTKNGKLRKRKPKEKNVYFTQDTEDAIIEYVSEENKYRRDRIYREKIHYALYKLVENIIHTFKFYYTEVDDIEDLKYEVISFLIQKLQLFNHSKYINDKLNKIIVKEFNESYVNGSFCEYVNNAVKVTKEQIDCFIDSLNVSNECKTQLLELYPPKAYSYFGTITKRYLIIYNKKNYKKLRSQYRVDEANEDDTVYNTLVEDNQEQEINRENLIDSFVDKMDLRFIDTYSNEEEIKVADAIIMLIKMREKIQIINKKAFFLYIKEITNANSTVITKVLKRMKGEYYTMLNDRIENYDD